MSELELLRADTVHTGGFYDGNGDSAVMMRIANFPDEILSLLQMEALVAFNALQFYACDAIVELGCYDGRSFEISRSAGVRYLGVDLDGTAIASLQSRIIAEGLGRRAEAVNANALHIDQWAWRVRARRSLIQLPFNFLGGFRDPLPLLRRLSEIPRALLLISVFNTDEYSTRVRKRYYSACGVDKLTLADGSCDAVIFTGGHNFFSRAFTLESLHELLQEGGLDVLFEVSNRLGRCVVTRFHRFDED
jgi:hypothetical protein